MKDWVGSAGSASLRDLLKSPTADGSELLGASGEGTNLSGMVRVFISFFAACQPIQILVYPLPPATPPLPLSSFSLLCPPTHTTQHAHFPS